MRKICLLAVFLSMFYCSANEQDIADAIRYVSEKSGVDARVYYSIIDIESDFKPYSISMVANSTILEATKNLPSQTYNVKSSRYKDKYLISVFSDSEEDIIKLAKVLYDFDFNIDMGLMQISKQHIQESELESIFNPKYNIIKGNNVLADCVKAYKVLSQSIECYNKGFRKKSALMYYQKFANSFNSHFGDNK
ncbi:MAG: transglycosylase SLT domain-containing protein [Campylobacteraceae bacterium]|nr:transglycosylase SLT domain-containing protein [Campylobacteraceae bacterium]